MGVKISSLTAQSTQSQGQTPADRSAIIEQFSVAEGGNLGKGTAFLLLKLA